MTPTTTDQTKAAPYGDNILHVKVAVPVPEIKTFSRWRVFVALFNPRSHFTTCETLQYQLRREIEALATSAITRFNKAKP